MFDQFNYNVNLVKHGIMVETRNGQQTFAFKVHNQVPTIILREMLFVQHINAINFYNPLTEVGP